MAQRRRSRVHDPHGRRADVLAAARRLFAARGYAQTSIRAIAAEAHVNQALVVTYFGGKENLFLEAVGRFQISESALAQGTELLGARLAHLYMERWEHMPADDPWPALVRSAVSHDLSNELLRRELAAQLEAPLRHVLGDSAEATVRNAMVQCLLGGMIMERYIYALEPARSVPAPTFEAALGACLQHAIDGDLHFLPPRHTT
jgi:AcrR family transcriptional regulator